jgi:hypothetical protein
LCSSARPGLPHLPVKAVGYSVKAEVSLCVRPLDLVLTQSLSQREVSRFLIRFPIYHVFYPLYNTLNLLSD